MKKAVFLDLYNTISYFEPSREFRQQQACRAFGIEVPIEALYRAYADAETYWTLENARQSIGRRPAEARLAFYADYERRLLEWAGIKVSLEQATEIYKHYRSLRRELRLFDDVLPLLTELRGRGIAAAIISNNDRALGPICQELGLDEHIEFGLSSWEIGFEKPAPHIFQEALRLAKVSASEALHVGDQYHSDVVGAWAVGIMPLLLDRFGFYSGIADCQHISGLMEVLYYLCI